MVKVTKEELESLRNEGMTYKKISEKFEISVSTIKRTLKSPSNHYPRYQSAKVTRLLVNARLIQVEYDGITTIAVKKPGYLYKLRQEVTLELVDEKTCRVL